MLALGDLVTEWVGCRFQLSLEQELTDLRQQKTDSLEKLKRLNFQARIASTYDPIENWALASESGMSFPRAEPPAPSTPSTPYSPTYSSDSVGNSASSTSLASSAGGVDYETFKSRHTTISADSEADIRKNPHYTVGLNSSDRLVVGD